MYLLINQKKSTSSQKTGKNIHLNYLLFWCHIYLKAVSFHHLFAQPVNRCNFFVKCFNPIPSIKGIKPFLFNLLGCQPLLIIKNLPQD